MKGWHFQTGTCVFAMSCRRRRQYVGRPLEKGYLSGFNPQPPFIVESPQFCTVAIWKMGAISEGVSWAVSGQGHTDCVGAEGVRGVAAAVALPPKRQAQQGCTPPLVKRHSVRPLSSNACHAPAPQRRLGFPFHLQTSPCTSQPNRGSRRGLRHVYLVGTAFSGRSGHGL